MTVRRRLLSTVAELDALDERESSRVEGCRPIGSVAPRERVRVAGILRSVTYPPVDDAPDLRAHLYDGTGELAIVLRGRREVPGIVPGRRLVAEGVVLDDDGPTLVDPAYELRPSLAELEEIDQVAGRHR
ncbi:OB-fold nucleic acid binding domain-containing protein [Georgenia sp. Z1344]|uniref:OB-fold nucleic acid binding domain-containing protein n=1 Tax=Georgenia sp. Z1344 TaxID=3416706 RepID=UPI003CE9963E